MRLSHLLAAIAGAVLLAQAAAIGPARADVGDLACNYDYVTFNACLNFQDLGEPDALNAHVGLDAFIADLDVMPGWPAAGADGLGAELSASVARGQLNVNASGDDAVYAIVSYFDYHTGSVKVFRTGTVHGDLGPTGGGEGCLQVCQ